VRAYAIGDVLREDQRLRALVRIRLCLLGARLQPDDAEQPDREDEHRDQHLDHQVAGLLRIGKTVHGQAPSAAYGRPVRSTCTQRGDTPSTADERLISILGVTVKCPSLPNTIDVTGVVFLSVTVMFEATVHVRSWSPAPSRT